jgi:hypothetical protein
MSAAAMERGRLAKAQADKIGIANKIALGNLVEAFAVVRPRLVSSLQRCRAVSTLVAWTEALQ